MDIGEIANENDLEMDKKGKPQGRNLISWYSSTKQTRSKNELD